MEARIVVIDNDKSMRALVTSALYEKGWQAFDYDYAHTDLAVVAQHHPDLIVLDFDFENVGKVWEFLQLVKMDDATAKVPILITTVVFLLPPEIRDYLLTHHIRVVHKSYDLDSFITIIQKTLTEASQSDAILLEDRTLPILVVDDTEEMRDTTVTVLRLEGYRVVSAADGLIALDRVSQADHCLILLDLAMPVMNGYEFLKAYERQLRPHSPVVVFTANAVIRDEKFPSFVVGILAKPFHIHQLLDVVSRYCEPVKDSP